MSREYSRNWKVNLDLNNNKKKKDIDLQWEGGSFSRFATTGLSLAEKRLFKRSLETMTEVEAGRERKRKAKEVIKANKLLLLDKRASESAEIDNEAEEVVESDNEVEEVVESDDSDEEVYEIEGNEVDANSNSTNSNSTNSNSALVRATIIASAQQLNRYTRRKYQYYHDQYHKFCIAKFNLTGANAEEQNIDIDEEKILMFLRDDISKRKGVKGPHVTMNTIKKTISALKNLHLLKGKGKVSTAGLDAYVSLYNAGTYLNPSENIENSEMYVRDYYTMREFRRIMKSFCSGPTAVPLSPFRSILPTAAFNHFRTWTDFAIGHFTLLRGVNRADLKLRDISVQNYGSVVDIEEDKNKRCIAFFIEKEKTGNEEKDRVSIAIPRHKEVMLCPIFALSSYMFARYEIGKDTPPDLSAAEKWKDIPVFVNHAVVVPWIKKIESDTLGVNLKDKLVSLGFGGEFSKATHLTRKGGATIASGLGVHKSEISKQGIWSGTIMEDVYIRGFPTEFLRVMSGHTSMEMISIDRDCLQPPPKLYSQIFSWIDVLLYFHEQNIETVDRAAYAFLKALDQMRRWLLQDVAIAMEQFPDNFMFRHPVFLSDEFKKFKSDLELEIGCITSRENDFEARQLPLSVKPMVEHLSLEISKVGSRSDAYYKSNSEEMSLLRQDISTVGSRSDAYYKSNSEEMSLLRQDISTVVEQSYSMKYDIRELNKKLDTLIQMVSESASLQPVIPPPPLPLTFPMQMFEQQPVMPMPNLHAEFSEYQPFGHQPYQFPKVISIVEFVKEWKEVLEPRIVSSRRKEEWLNRSNLSTYKRRLKAYKTIIERAFLERTNVEHAAILTQQELTGTSVHPASWVNQPPVLQPPPELEAFPKHIYPSYMH